MNNKKIKENYLNDICPAFELFDIVKKVALSLIKLKDFHSDIEKCNLYTIDMENGKVNKLHFHCGKGIYICINKLLFHVENENICQLHFSTKEFVNKWIKLCEEKTIEEYENNEFIPALAEHIND